MSHRKRWDGTLSLQRRLSGFRGLVHKAAWGDPDPLIHYFENGPRQLSEEDCAVLAWYFRKTLKGIFERQRGDRGKGKPKSEPRPHQIAREVMVEQKAWREQHQCQHVPVRVTIQMIRDKDPKWVNAVLILLKNKSRL